jgi:catechol 2,3-dioxygenase-like lactoylglutathione lyase family enzyme
MLLNGVNHVAILTSDSDRLHRFYRGIFDATVSRDTTEGPGMRLSFVDIGPHTQLNVFEIEGNTEAIRQTPMFGRGRIDHLGLEAMSKERSTSSETASLPQAPATGSSRTSVRS